MRLTPNDPRHGTVNGYANLGCRCSRCRAAATAYAYKYQHDTCECGQQKNKRASRCRACDVANREAPHGSEGRYNRGCRCDECRTAASAARKRRRLANPEATRAYYRARWHGRKTAA